MPNLLTSLKQKLTALPPKVLVSSGLAVFLLITISLSFHFYSQSKQARAEVTKLKQTSDAASLEEVKKLVDKLGQIVELPTGEDPTVATITDKSKLADQPFFQKADNGDKVLIYSAAKKAYLYRPSTNKLLDIAPVNLGNTAPTPQVAGVATTPTRAPTPMPSETP